MSPRFLISLIAGVAFAGPLLARRRRKAWSNCSPRRAVRSCPPADAAFRKLVERGDVIALAYHVDYWNYLGWADTLSSKENTERQYGYARTMGRANVYTPQVVVNGRDHVTGSDLGGIEKKIDGFLTEGEG
jgi:hypothetical protein